MLKVENLEAGYGSAQVLFGVDLAVKEAEAVALIGRNGMGKTTTIRSIMGLIRPSAGTIAFHEDRIDALAPHVIARKGIGLVPEGRQIFSKLSVEENLVATAFAGHGTAPQWTLQRVFTQFPRLFEHRRQSGASLSGGEQQMLAIARALMTNPRLLILDEATEGLAPKVRKEIWQALMTIKAEGLSLLIVDRNIDALLRFTDRQYVMAKGKIVCSGTAADLRDQRTTVEGWMSV